jgi:hypothetical protein
MKNLSTKFRAAIAGAVLGGAALVAVAAPAAASNVNEPAKDVSARAAFAEVICQDTYRNGYYVGRQCHEVYRQPVNPGLQMFGVIINEIARQQQMERHRHHHPHYVPRHHYPHPHHRHHH